METASDLTLEDVHIVKRCPFAALLEADKKGRGIRLSAAEVRFLANEMSYDLEVYAEQSPFNTQDAPNGFWVLKYEKAPGAKAEGS